MPLPLVAKGAVVAVSVAVATAIALYENPELRRYADDVRRRIAIALNGGQPPASDDVPLFNRPEDADGFLLSRQGGADGVDADEETRRKQREELMYWNSQLLKKESADEDEKKGLRDGSVERKPQARRGSSFDDFLRQDESAEQGAYIFNSGAEVHTGTTGLRNRGECARGLNNASHYANPFADEFNIGTDEVSDAEDQCVAPTRDEVSDIYSVTTNSEFTPAPSESTAALVDVNPTPSRTASTATLERELEANEFMTAGQDERDEAYASIQAWAQDSSPGFYSPLPVTPTAPVSEPEMVSDGQLTPPDSVSVIGSGEHLDNDAQSSRAGDNSQYYDVISDSESEGMATPASWSEVGSVISESDAPVPVRR